MIVNRIITEHKTYFIKFCLVGGLATILNYAVFFILFQFLNMNYLLSSGMGYISGVFLGFGLNKKFTFKSKSNRYGVEVVKYLIVYTSSLFLGLGILKALAFFGLNILFANVIIIGITTITNYIGSKFFVFHPHKLIRKMDYWIYRYRYLTKYMIIGLASIFLEVLIISLLNIQIISFVKTIIGFVGGMLFSFALNSQLNFKVPAKKNLQTLKMFTIISVFAYVLNIILIRLLFEQFVMIEYSILRFVSAACIFLISYSLHRKFTFTDVKEVGVAIYLAKDEDIEKIRKKVSYYTDWIHVDLVDKTFNLKAKDVDIIKGYEIRRYWPNLKIMTHIMSKNPSSWVKKVAPFSDYIIVHAEIDDSIDPILRHIKQLGKKAGISIMPQSSIKAIIPYLNKINLVQILGIKKPGYSGQHMRIEGVQNLKRLNKMKKRYKFEICFDGGINLNNVNKIDAKYIVSGSAVLNSKNVTKSINALKTSSKYYYEHGNDLKRFLKKKIFKILEDIDFVKSGTLVGSFVEKGGLEGISDIDTIVIVDKLTKPKFDKIVSSFKELESVLKVDFDHNLIINTTFGPLKFNKKETVVMHLMIYDIQSHIQHCLKSPFTCLDWQRSEHFVKQSLSQIWEVTTLQPNYFFNARRSVEDYIKDFRKNIISYREYKFHGKKIQEIKKEKIMTNKDKFEFNYHIMKFCMLNFLKMHDKKNEIYPLEDLMDQYFNIFPHNRKIYSNYLLKIKKMKQLNQFSKWKQENEHLIYSFLKNFEKQFKHYFDTSATHLHFIRHQKTLMNKEGIFLGQRNDPEIIKTKNHDAIKNAIKPFINKKINGLYSSPAKRCMQTINLFKKELKVSSVIIDDNLHEIDYGEADGKDYIYLQKNYPLIIEGWKENKDLRFPNGENTADVLKRMHLFIDDYNNQENHRNSGNYLICTHNVLLRCLIGKYFNIPMHKWHLIEIPHLESIHLIHPKKGKYYIDLNTRQREILLKNIILKNDSLCNNT